jgi:hypothetical protein
MTAAWLSYLSPRSTRGTGQAPVQPVVKEQQHHGESKQLQWLPFWEVIQFRSKGGEMEGEEGNR